MSKDETFRHHQQQMHEVDHYDQQEQRQAHQTFDQHLAAERGLS